MESSIDVLEGLFCLVQSEFVIIYQRLPDINLTSQDRCKLMYINADIDTNTLQFNILYVIAKIQVRIGAN